MITAPRAALRRMLLVKFLQPCTQSLDTLTKQTTVRLKLGFTRPSQPDTTFLSLKVSPATNQTCREMLQLRQLNLYLSFMTFGTLRKNVENQARAINHTYFQMTFKVALLRGRKGMIENHDLDLMIKNRIGNLFCLTRTDEQGCIRTLPTTGDSNHRIRASRT